MNLKVILQETVYSRMKLEYYTLISVVYSTACVDGQVLLYNGSYLSPNLTEGTVLVCYNNTYGAVCDDFWDELEARIICRQLGYGENGTLL